MIENYALTKINRTISDNICFKLLPDKSNNIYGSGDQILPHNHNERVVVSIVDQNPD